MATILNGDTDSDTIDLTGKKLVAFVSDGNFKGSHVGLLYQVAANVWFPVQDSWGRRRAIALTNWVVTALDVEQQDLSKNQTFRLRADEEQTQDVTITLVTEDLV